MRHQDDDARQGNRATEGDDPGDALLPAADPELTDAEKLSTDEGRTEEDLEP